MYIHSKYSTARTAFNTPGSSDLNTGRQSQVSKQFMTLWLCMADFHDITVY